MPDFMLMTADETLSSLGLDALLAEERFPAGEPGGVTDAAGTPVMFAPPALLRSVHHVLERERTGTWRLAMKTSGLASGHHIARDLEARLAALHKPALAALPLEGCLAIIERYFATHGWGRLALDLTDAAEHGLVVARVEESFFAQIFPEPKRCAGVMLAGILQAFFEHLTGQTLACEDITVSAITVSSYTFVIAPPERLAAIGTVIGKESVEAVLARLRA